MADIDETSQKNECASRKQLPSKKYFTDLSSKYIAAVPSLHLTNEKQKPCVYDSNEFNNSQVETDLSDPYSVYKLSNVAIQSVAQFYYFDTMDVMLYGDNGLYENNFCFRKCKNPIPFEGYVKFCLFNRCSFPVAFKILGSNLENIKASPNMGIIQCNKEERVAIYLKKWNEPTNELLVFKIKIAKLDENFDVSSIWHCRDSIVNVSPQLHCIFIQEVPTQQQQFSLEQSVEDVSELQKYANKKFIPPSTVVAKCVEEKQTRMWFFTRFFQRMTKVWRRICGKPMKTGSDRWKN